MAELTPNPVPAAGLPLSNALQGVEHRRDGFLAPNELARVEWHKLVQPLLTTSQISRLEGHYVINHEGEGASRGVPFFDNFHLLPPDPVTGFLTPQTRFATINRTIEHCARTNTVGLYIEGDIANLTGLNRYVESNQQGNRVYRMITDRFRHAITLLGGTATFYRHGGDEFCAIVAGITPEVADYFLNSGGPLAPMFAARGIPTLASLRGGILRSLAELSIPSRRNEKGELLFVENPKHPLPEEDADPHHPEYTTRLTEAIRYSGVGAHVAARLITSNTDAVTLLDDTDVLMLGVKEEWFHHRGELIKELGIRDLEAIRLTPPISPLPPPRPRLSAVVPETVGLRCAPFLDPERNLVAQYRVEVARALPEIAGNVDLLRRICEEAGPPLHLRREPVSGTVHPLYRTSTFHRLADSMVAGTAGASYAATVSFFNLKGLNRAFGVQGANEVLAAVAKKLSEELGTLNGDNVLLFRQGPSFDILVPNIGGTSVREIERAMSIALRNCEQWLDERQRNWTFSGGVAAGRTVDLREIVHPNHDRDPHTRYRGVGLQSVAAFIDPWSISDDYPGRFGVWTYLYKMRTYREQTPPSLEERMEFWREHYGIG